MTGKNKGWPLQNDTAQKVDTSTFSFPVASYANKFATTLRKTKGVEYSTPFCFVCFLRKERDSNPRIREDQRFSRPPQSTTLPSFHGKQTLSACPRLSCCGKEGIRTPETLLAFTHFPGEPVQPLLHLSFSRRQR